MSPRLRRAAVAWAQTAYRVSQRRACRALDVERTAVRYQPRRDPATALRRRLHELAVTRLTFGSRRLHTPLHRDGIVINYKRVHRLYVEEDVQLKPRHRRRRKPATLRAPRTMPTQPNERWAMDFMHDVLQNGRAIRVFAPVDECTRECVALRAAVGFKVSDVAAFLFTAGAPRGGLPAVVQCDNGTEFTSTAPDHWAYWNQVGLDFSRLGQPFENCACKAFNGSLRRECLSMNWFGDLA
ncbi:MAG: transposase [Gemmatimonadaceae bacterium]|nr:transposase [Gemmatimonadaceae bacterium]